MTAQEVKNLIFYLHSSLSLLSTHAHCSFRSQEGVEWNSKAEAASLSLVQRDKANFLHCVRYVMTLQNNKYCGCRFLEFLGCPIKVLDIPLIQALYIELVPSKVV